MRLHGLGRRLTDEGLKHPDGTPVLYCHGFPSSRRETRRLHPGTRGLGVRVLAPDRPGCGDSDPQHRRGFDDQAKDVADLADHPRLARLALLGVPGGAPDALARVTGIQGRISACAPVCPLGHVYLDQVLAAMPWPSRRLLGLARRAAGPPPLRFGRPRIRIVARWRQGTQGLRADWAPPPDLAELGNPEVRAILGGAFRDAMRRGAAGARQDLYRYPPLGYPAGSHPRPD